MSDEQRFRKLEEKLTGLEKLTRDVDKDIQTLRTDLTTEVTRLAEVITAFTKDPPWRE